MAISLGPVQAHVKAYAEALASMFGIKTAGGWRKSDQFPDHPSGLAVDFMITDIGSGGVAGKNPGGKAAGDAMAAYLVANHKALNVKYVIWNRQVWSAEKATQGWRPYTQAGQGPHDDHLHVTWLPGVGAATPGSLPAYVPVAGGLGGKLVETLGLDTIVKKAQDSMVTLTVAGVGMVLVGAGIWVAVSPQAGRAVKTVRSAVSL